VGNDEGIDPFMFIDKFQNRKINKNKKANSKLSLSDF